MRYVVCQAFPTLLGIEYVTNIAQLPKHKTQRPSECYTVGMPNIQKRSASPVSKPAGEPAVVPLPLWQRTYLGALQAGAGQDASAKCANVSTGVIAEWTDPTGARFDAVFARAREVVLQGVALLGVDQVRQMATDASALMVTDAVAESRDQDNNARDRLGNRRFVAEAGGIFPTKGVGVTVNVQTNVGFSRFDNRPR